MRVFTWIAAFGLVLVIAALAISSYFTVDRTEFVYVTQFGRHVATYDGETDAGWHWKLPWPVQSVQRLDRRLQVFDLPETEVLTRDRQTIDKTLTIGAFVCWRVADRDGVDRFIRSVGTAEKARAIIGQQVSSRLGAAISTMPVQALIDDNTAKTRTPREREDFEKRMDRIRDQLLGPGESGGDSLRDTTRREYGIELVDVRLRRFNHAPSVRDAIFDRIKSERSEKARTHDSEANKLSRDILSRADRDARDTLTRARSEADLMRKQADVKADEIRNEAHARDPKFYAFLQKLKTYQAILGETRDVLLLSSQHDLFDMLLKPPKVGTSNGTEPLPPKVPVENGTAPKTGGQ
jgi:membrane protease subunit HflC